MLTAAPDRLDKLGTSCRILSDRVAIRTKARIARLGIPLVHGKASATEPKVRGTEFFDRDG